MCHGVASEKNISRSVQIAAILPGVKCRPLLFLVLLGVFVLPQHAWADAGTPLMWAGMLHLVFGNTLVGIGEGALLAWCFSVPKVRAVWVMILANYVSAWLGLFLIDRSIDSLPMDLNNGWKWFWAMVVVTYFMTILVEWPFVAWCFRGTQDWFQKSVKASLVVQTASYVLLFGWYWMASGTSLYTQMSIVGPSELSLPESVLVYFISPKDGDVYSRHLSGKDERKVFELHTKNINDRLLVRASTPDTSRWDLVARVETEDYGNPRLIAVKTNMQVEAAADWRSTHTDPPQYESTWFSFGEVEPIGSAADSQWKFWTGFWPIEGLQASNKATGDKVRFSYETPFGAWIVRNAVHLPSDKVLFQLGKDQICAFDPVHRRVALLWHGRGPVPVIEKTEGGPESVEKKQTFRPATNQVSPVSGFER